MWHHCSQTAYTAVFDVAISQFPCQLLSIQCAKIVVIWRYSTMRIKSDLIWYSNDPCWQFTRIFPLFLDVPLLLAYWNQGSMAPCWFGMFLITLCVFVRTKVSARTGFFFALRTKEEHSALKTIRVDEALISEIYVLSKGREGGGEAPPIHVKVVNVASLWKAYTAAVWWCPGSLQEPKYTHRGKKRECQTAITSTIVFFNEHWCTVQWYFTFLVFWGRMTPSSQSLPEEKKAELSSINLAFRSSSCSPSGGSRELESPGAVIDTLLFGHRNRKLGSKARPHWREPGKKLSDYWWIYPL